MKRISLDAESRAPNFIGAWSMDSSGLCDDLIDYFENNQSKQTTGTTSGGVNLEVKDTSDVTVLPKEIKLPGNAAFESSCLLSRLFRAMAIFCFDRQ